MNKDIKKVKLFINHNDKSKNIAMIVENAFKNKIEVVDKDYDLAIAIGGDGSFLRMVKENLFDSNIYYVGINAGTLGFLQEIKLEEIDDFVDNIVNQKFSVTPIGIQETSVITKESKSFFYSLNDIVIRDGDLNTCKLKVFINDNFLERYVGDGLLIATSIGSTAYNLSFGGSIVFEDFHTLQLTPIAPLNTKAYRSLLNSIIIPENRIISITPDGDSNKFIITVDGENLIYEDVLRIETVVNNKKINCIRFDNNSFVNKIHDKFLKN